MCLKSFLYSSSLLVLLALPAMAAEPLAPRGEVSVKGGTDRSLLTTEFWAPLAQQSDRVLYGDIRLMGDNDENREGNLGLGYRQIKNDAVVGVHGWIDRRRTQHNSTFHQLTFGVERLGHIIDARANIYIPINNGRTIITPNIGVTSPYLAGSGIYYDTNGSINETPQYGLDGELGYRIPVFKKQIDAIRVYGGGYYFFRDNTVEVPGTRFRTEAQVNKIFSVGARVQYDKPRGTQGFLEATLKFPFSAKRLYQESSIRSRLDESPERDVDIVTESKVTDTGLRKPVIDAVTGTQQRILYVDNTKADGGDGSYEKPFNNLKAAEAALQANDILYVNRGDGTTRNMNQGIVIDKPNVQLIGSATPLTYGGYTLLNAGAAPVITNNATFFVNALLGNGILVTSDDVTISGITIDRAYIAGIAVASLNPNQPLNNIKISNISAVNGNRGISIFNNIDGVGFGSFGSITIENSFFSNNTAINRQNFIINLTNASVDKLNITGNIMQTSVATGILISGNNVKYSHINIDNNDTSGTNRGLQVSLSNNTQIDNISLSNSTSNNNTQNSASFTLATSSLIKNVAIDNYLANNSSAANGSISFSLATNSKIEDLLVKDTMMNNGSGQGIFISANNALIDKIRLNNVTANNNGSHGIQITSAGGSIFGNINISNTISNNNTGSGRGIYIEATGTGSSITTTTLSNNTSNANASSGIYVRTTNTSQIGTLTLNGNTSNSNLNANGYGVHIEANGNGAMIGSLAMNNNTTNSNAQSGVYLLSISSGVVNSSTILNGISNSNTQSGVYIYANGGTINNTTLTNTIASSNAQQGVYFNSSSTGILNGAVLSGITASNNVQNGLYINGSNATTSIINNISVASSNFLNNAVNGIFLQKSNAGATFNVDLGGGGSASIGQNRSFGNTGKDLRLNYTGGGAVFAKNNWWGDVTGLQAGRVTLSASTTVDSTAFLTSDPRP